MGHEDENVRSDAIEALSHLGPNHPRFVSAAIGLLDDEDENVLISTLQALRKVSKKRVRKVSKKGDIRIPRIVSVLSRKDRNRIGRAVQPFLSEDMEHVRREAAEALCDVMGCDEGFVDGALAVQAFNRL